MDQSNSSHEQPSDYGSPAEEFIAATQRTAIFRLGHRTQLELTGKDRQKYLHNFCTNEIRNLQPGQSCEAFVTTIQGKIKAHIFVFAQPDSLWIDAEPGSEDLLYAHLDKYLITEDVEFHRRSQSFSEFYLSGPETPSRLLSIDHSVADLAVNRSIQTSLLENPISIRRMDWFGTPGCLIQIASEAEEKAWNAFIAKGFTPAGRTTFDACRILALFPEYGVDLTDDNLAQEAARTNLAISFTKGCYLGQEPIARIDSMGHVNQELRGLRLSGTEVPAAGTKVVMPNEVREAGVITSASRDFSTGEPIALALIKRNYLSPGMKLSVTIGDAEVSATVFSRD